MHLTHLPQSLIILLLTLTRSTIALPSIQIPLVPNLQKHDTIDPARQQRLEAWLAQKPLHTTALLAGAAATAVPEAQIRNGRRRDLSGITGEKGMWIPIEHCDGGDEVDGKRGSKIGDVRGERTLEMWLEDMDVDVDADVDVEDDDVVGYGVRGFVDRVWRELEKIGLVLERKKQQMEKVKELENGHDGDL